MTTTSSCGTYPRIDRHLHLEGALHSAWILARSQGKVSLPQSLTRFWAGQSASFSDFIQAFLFSSSFLDCREALAEAVVQCSESLLSIPGHSPAGLDIWISPHLLIRRQGLLQADAVWRGLEEGRERLLREGISCCFVLDAVNHLGPKDGFELLDLLSCEHPPWVVGFSTGGREDVSFQQWSKVFEQARKLGLKTAAHAGETGSAASVREAVQWAGVERIVHGLTIGRDPSLIHWLAERRIAVDVCLSSNLALGILPKLEDHPLREWIASGLRCGLGTDDPGIVPTNLSREWTLAGSLGLDQVQLDQLKRWTWEDAWCFSSSPS